MNTCVKCNIKLEEGEIRYRSEKYCSKRCQILYLKAAYRRRMRIRINEYNREWRSLNPEKIRLQRSRYLTRRGISPRKERVTKLKITRIYEIPCGFCPNKIYLSKRKRAKCGVHKRSVGKAIRFRIMERDRFTCQYCGRKAPDVVLQVDHITPKAKGGDNTTANLITACFDCNIGKRDKILLPSEL